MVLEIGRLFLRLLDYNFVAINDLGSIEKRTFN